MPQISVAELEYHTANARRLRAQAFAVALAAITALFRKVPEQIAPAVLRGKCERTVIT